MPKYLIQATYSSEGVQGLLKGGGSARRAAVEAAVKSAGGRLEALYFAFGQTDGFAILDLPDNASAAALALAISASGAGSAKTTVLLTPEEMDAATKKTVSYRAPGH
jgi:uncharacterized protein with GYD domain